MPKKLPPSKRRRPDPPRTTSDRLRLTTHVIIATCRQLGDDDEEISRKVLDAFRTAVEGEATWSMDVDLPGGRERCLSMPGMFKLVLDGDGHDRKDQRSQEGWLATVQRALDEGLEVADWSAYDLPMGMRIR